MAFCENLQVLVLKSTCRYIESTRTRLGSRLVAEFGTLCYSGNKKLPLQSWFPTNAQKELQEKWSGTEFICMLKPCGSGRLRNKFQISGNTNIWNLFLNLSLPQGLETSVKYQGAPIHIYCFSFVIGHYIVQMCSEITLTNRMINWFQLFFTWKMSIP